MKRLLKLILFILLAIGLVACSDKEETSDVTKGDEVTEPTKQNAEQDKEEVNDNESGDSEWGEDQLDLKIGDTGTVNTNFATYQITMNSVEFMDKIGEEHPQADRFVLIKLTIKNIGNESLNAEDALADAMLATEPGSSGTSWFYKDGIAEEWPGEIEPNESQTGAILFDVSNSDEYVLQFGTFFESVSNEVRFLFTDEDAK
ncbi:hypothetical protein HNQ35_002689 [Cerasibacillus quisquiliarum]|uniref:DUF4352 domain-containing protein n=2 Tax=Cerasibacillus quisquiliarum TaxID=227865 RepID=UPI0016102137|nr:DUF4352 domain-containing protein [Cerasibacillus quisquiliarum]MBB5147460.1 hypothetical protein [Cerasibacillus quisquiliarum]